MRLLRSRLQRQLQRASRIAELLPLVVPIGLAQLARGTALLRLCKRRLAHALGVPVAVDHRPTELHSTFAFVQSDRAPVGAHAGAERTCGRVAGGRAVRALSGRGRGAGRSTGGYSRSSCEVPLDIIAATCVLMIAESLAVSALCSRVARARRTPEKRTARSIAACALFHFMAMAMALLTLWLAVRYADCRASQGEAEGCVRACMRACVRACVRAGGDRALRQHTGR